MSHLILLTFSMLLPAITQDAPTSASPKVHKITVGGEGGWDYLTVDSAARRLYVSRGNRVIVLDLDTEAVVGEMADTPGVHGIAVVPELGKGFTSNGRDSSVTVFDLKTLKPTNKIKASGVPDAILFDPSSKRVITFNHGTNDGTSIDPASEEVAGTIAFGGEPEAAVADGRGHIFVNIRSSSEVVEFDALSLKILNRWPLAPGQRPNGLAIDAKKRRLFSGCNGNSKMVVMDADKGTVIATVDIGRGSDGCGFDPAKGLAYSSNGGDGTVTIIGEPEPGKFKVVATVPTQATARTMTHRPEDASPLPLGRHPGSRPPRGPDERRSKGQCPGLIRDHRGGRLISASATFLPSSHRTTNARWAGRRCSPVDFIGAAPHHAMALPAIPRLAIPGRRHRLAQGGSPMLRSIRPRCARRPFDAFVDPTEACKAGPSWVIRVATAPLWRRRGNVRRPREACCRDATSAVRIVASEWPPWCNLIAFTAALVWAAFPEEPMPPRASPPRLLEVPTMISKNHAICMLWLVAALVCLPGAPVRGGDIVLDFSDVPPGTLAVFNPYTSQGFTLTSSSGGFVFNSPDTGNGSSQPVGNNPFYAGANGLAAFSPATITLTQTNGDPFSLLSIDLARNFEFDPAPTVTFTGTLAGGGTVSETFTVTTPPPPSPASFQTFDFTGFTDVTSVSWDQPVFTQGLHQFTNIHLSTEPSPSPPR